jgi:hypothetical protein
MPVYLNSTSTPIEIAGIRLEPNEQTATNKWIPGVLPAGISKVKDTPYYTDILYSAKISTTTTYDIPATITDNYKLTFYCTAVEASVKLNSSDSVAKSMGVGEKYEVTCMTRIINSVIFTISSGVIYFTISAI